MSLLAAHGYEAVFGTPEGDTYRVPLICWREDGEHMSGMVLVRGHLRRAEQQRDFLCYADRNSTGPDRTSPSFGAAVPGNPSEQAGTPARR